MRRCPLTIRLLLTLVLVRCTDHQLVNNSSLEPDFPLSKFYKVEAAVVVLIQASLVTAFTEETARVTWVKEQCKAKQVEFTLSRTVSTVLMHIMTFAQVHGVDQPSCLPTGVVVPRMIHAFPECQIRRLLVILVREGDCRRLRANGIRAEWCCVEGLNGKMPGVRHRAVPIVS